MGSAGVGSAGVGSAGVGSAGVGSGGVGSAEWVVQVSVVGTFKRTYNMMTFSL